MHRPRNSAAKTCRFRENIGKNSENKEAACGRFYIIRREFSANRIVCCRIFLCVENFRKLFVGHFADCRKAFCENFVVASVRTENKVVFVKIESFRNGGRFLTYRKMTRSFEEKLFVRINLFFFYVAEHLFEKAYREHIFIDIFKVFF